MLKRGLFFMVIATLTLTSFAQENLTDIGMGPQWGQRLEARVHELNRLYNARQAAVNDEASEEAQNVFQDFSDQLQEKIMRAVRAALASSVPNKKVIALVNISKPELAITVTRANQQGHLASLLIPDFAFLSLVDLYGVRAIALKVNVAGKESVITGLPVLNEHQLLVVTAGINHKNKIGARLFIYDIKANRFISTKLLPVLED